MNNIFGTDGIRGPAGKGFFTSENLETIGHSLAIWAQEKYKQPRILICNDTRESANWIKQDLAKGLKKENVFIFDAEILPTPGASTIVHISDNYDIAIVISASHNPYEDNGIKVFDRLSTRITPNDEEKISLLIQKIPQPQSNSLTLPTITLSPEVHENYISHIIDNFGPQFIKGKKVILDCANGATFKIAPEIFSRCGAEVIPINNAPNGKNINEKCGSTNPKMLQQTVREMNADIGFAFDGDGDRVITVSNNGEIKDGDDMLAVLCEHPAYQNEQAVVGTIMSNQGFAAYLRSKGKTLVRAAVGEKNVYNELVQRNSLLGGELCGHVILRNHLPTGDGIYAALKIMESCQATGNWELRTFEKFPQILLNVEVNQKADLNAEPLATYISNAEKKTHNGRVVVRYSGTQNILRVMVEEQNEAMAQEIAQSLAQELQGALAA